MSSNQKKGKIGEFNDLKSKVGEVYLKNIKNDKKSVQPFKEQTQRLIYNQTTSKSCCIQINKLSNHQKRKTISHIGIDKR